MKVLGIEFAPLDIPMERRLQTLAVTSQFLLLVILAPLSYLFVTYFILCTNYYWMVLAYVAFMVGERGVAARGSRRVSWVRRLSWWTYFRDYFPIRLKKTAELDPSGNHLLCAFPHGVLSSGVFLNFATDATNVEGVFPGITVYPATLDQNFRMPFTRELLLSLSMISASRESLDFILSRTRGTGRAVALVVGGAAESLKCKPGTYRVILKNRKGFVKVALRNGCSLVPVFSFGENELYDQVDNPEGSRVRWWQDFVRSVTGIAPVLMVGRGVFQYSFGIIPQRRPVTTVVGKPMPAEHIPDPTQDQIDDLHKRFQEQLIALFEEHKHHYHENADKISLVIE